MGKFIIILLLFLIKFAAFAQQEQKTKEAYYYVVKGVLYPKQYDIEKRIPLDTHKVPKDGLKFKIVGEEINPKNNAEIYLIQFFPITNDNITVFSAEGKKQSISLTGSSTFINSKDNYQYFYLEKKELESSEEKGYAEKRYNIKFNPQMTYGATLAIPFKYRPKAADQNVKITPDITLGGFVGFKQRINRFNGYYISTPVTLGLVTLPVNDNTTTQNSEQQQDGLVLGVTLSLGIVMHLEDFQLGLMTGWDRAAGEIGKDWIYNNKQWISFSIGYTFIGRQDISATK